jgi:hypothetical protein
MRRRPDLRVLTVLLLVALVALGAVVVWWYGQGYLERAGGLRESEARTHCREEVRWETGYGRDAELDLWGARHDREGDRWIIDGQVFAEHLEGVEVTHGARTDGEQFRCLVSTDRVVVEMVD